MNVMRMAAVIVLCLTKLMAQEPVPTPAPAPDVSAEAKKLWDAADQRSEKMRDYSYHVVLSSTDQPDETTRAAVKVRLSGDKNGFPFTQYHVQLPGSDNKPGIEWAMNGQQIQKLDHSSKVLLTMKVDEKLAMSPPPTLWMTFPFWMGPDGLDESMVKAVTWKIHADAEVDKVKCRVIERSTTIEIPMEEEGEVFRLVQIITRSIGADDLLVRRVEMASEMGNEGATEGRSVTRAELSNVKADSDLKVEDFVLVAPEGFKSEEGTKENLGLENQHETPEMTVKVGDKALDFKLKDLGDKEVTRDSLKGRIVVLDFWATWCGPCKSAMPAIQRLHDHFKDKPVSILGVNVWEKDETAGPEYMKKKEYSYGCLVKGDDLAVAYGVSGIPTLIVFDGEGTILHIAVGFGKDEEEHLKTLITSKLGESK